MAGFLGGLGSLFVGIEASAADFKADLEESKKNLNKFKTDSQKVTSEISRYFKRIGTTILSYFSVRAIEGAIRGWVEYADILKKLSIQTGISTDKIAGLKFAAEQSETSILGLSFALNWLNRQLGSTDKGGKIVREQIERLGISFLELEKAKPDERFLILADALSKVEDKGKRANIAATLFGRGFREILPLINQGREGIEKYMEQAERMGIAFSLEQVEKIDAFGDKVKEIGTQFKGAAFLALNELLPALSDLTTSISNAIPYWVNYGKTLSLIKTESFGMVIDSLIAEKVAIESNLRLKERMLSWFLKYKKSMDELGKPGALLGKANPLYWMEIAFKNVMPDADKNVTSLANDTKNLKEALSLVNTDIGKGLVDWDAWLKKTKDQKDATGGLGNETGDLNKALKEEISYLKPINDLLDDAYDKYGAMTGAINDYKTAMYKSKYGVDLSGIKPGEYELPLTGAGEWWKSADIGAEKKEEIFGPPRELMSPWSKFTESISTNWSNSMSNMTTTGNFFLDAMLMVVKDLAEAFSNFARGIRQDLSDAFYRMLKENQKFCDSFSEMWESTKDRFKRAVSDMAAALIANFTGLSALEKLGSFGQGGNVSGGSLPKFAYGGMASGSSLPKIPHAAQGMYTGAGTGAIPIIAHPREWIIPDPYIKNFFGTMAERLFSGASLPTNHTYNQQRSVNVTLQIRGGTFNDPKYWKKIVRENIEPAMREVAYGRVH